MKKIFTKIFSVFALILMAVGVFAGCSDGGSKITNQDNSIVDDNLDSENVSNNNERQIIISFDTRYGTLSFNSIKLKLGDEKIYLEDKDFPTISNEGDERILDKWVYDNGVEFSSEIPINKDIALHATFVTSEFIWVATWDQYMDSIHYLGNIKHIMEGIYSPTSALRLTTKHDPTKAKKYCYKKIKKSECLDEYITKTELQQFMNTFCFLTSSNGEEKIVTERDVTTDVYQYNIAILVGGWYFGYNSVGFLPKGCNLYANKNIINASLRTFLQFYCENVDKEYPSTTQYESAYWLDNSSSKHCVIKNDEDRAKLTLEDIRKECNDELYECKYNFQDDYYCGLIVCDYVYYRLVDKTTNAKYFSFMAKDWTNSHTGDLINKTNCSEEEFEEFTSYYNLKHV